MVYYSHSGIPHPIPYQGSKRRLATVILQYHPGRVRYLIEPFAGSAAVTLAAAYKKMADQYIIGDILEPLVGIWEMILSTPELLTDQYEMMWKAQLDNPHKYYLRIREEFNNDGDPAKLLYLLARCVKNAVRFNIYGKFNQSADHRRKGMHPKKMKFNIFRAHELLCGRCQAICGDYSKLLEKASSNDLIYMDPPYQGVSGNKDSRYFKQINFDNLMEKLTDLNTRGIKYMLSYDGSCGSKRYGKDLPHSLDLTQIQIHVGKSAQATLTGMDKDTVESLYISPSLMSIVKDISSNISIVHDSLQIKMSF